MAVLTSEITEKAMRVSVIAQVDGFNSHALHLAQLVKRLPEHGIELVIRPRKLFREGTPEDVLRCVQPGANDCEIEIILGQPRVTPTEGKRTIYMAAWESTVLPPLCVANLNRAELIITPSQFCAQVFSSCGVTRPIVVVPLGYSEEFFYRQKPENDRLSFACGGNLRNGPKRKGIQRIIEDFVEAFPVGTENVLLNVKLGPGQTVNTFGDPRICVCADRVDASRMAHRLATVDCFIHYACGAFELMPLEAMAVGRPVIAPRWGGHADFFNADVGLEIAHRLVPASDSWTGLGHWAEPIDDAAIDAMRWAYKHREYLEKLGFNAHISVRGLTWANHAERIARVIHAMAKPVAPAVQPKGTVGERNWDMWKNGVDEFAPFEVQCEELQWESGVFDFGEKDPKVLRFNPGLCLSGVNCIFPRRTEIDDRGDRTKSTIECWIITPNGVGERRPIDLGVQHPEDARAFVHNDRVYLSYANLERMEGKWCVRQYVAKLNLALNRRCEMRKPEFGGNLTQQWEKNWLWFVHEDEQHFIYDSSHCVVRMGAHCTKIAEEYRAPHDWREWEKKWGTPRGGTPPVRIGDEYITLFHSSYEWMPERHRNRYCVGAYAFEAKPPFRITRHTRKPIFIGSSNKPEMILPHANVFVMGAVVEDAELFVTTGINDESCAWFRAPIAELQEMME